MFFFRTDKGVLRVPGLKADQMLGSCCSTHCFYMIRLLVPTVGGVVVVNENLA